MGKSDITAMVAVRRLSQGKTPLLCCPDVESAERLRRLVNYYARRCPVMPTGVLEWNLPQDDESKDRVREASK